MLHTLTMMGPQILRKPCIDGPSWRARGAPRLVANVPAVQSVFIYSGLRLHPLPVPDRFPRRDSTRTTRLLPDAALGVATPLIITG
jgi:hypothetical protein